MRTTTLLCTMLFLTSCATPPAPDTGKASPEAAKAAPTGDLNFYQTDSPIVVTDGSIHWKKHNDFHIIDPNLVVADIDSSKPFKLTVAPCAGATCANLPVTLALSSWTVSFHNLAGTTVATLTYKGYDSIRIESTYPFEKIHLPAGPPNDTEYPGGGAPGVEQRTANVTGANYNGADYKCPDIMPAKTKCQVKLVQ